MKPLSLNFHPFPEIRTGRLLLRRIGSRDSLRMFELRSNPLVMQYIDRPRAASVDEGHEMILKMDEALRSNTGITWGISLESDPSLLGTIGFWRIDTANYRAEIGYMLDDAWHRKGIASEAMQAVLAYGFDTMRLHSVEANVNPANHASISLLEKHGFVREAYFRENYFFDGRFLDSVIYSKLAG